MFDLLFLGSVTVQEKTVNHVSWMMWLVLEYNFFLPKTVLFSLKGKIFIFVYCLQRLQDTTYHFTS